MELATTIGTLLAGFGILAIRIAIVVLIIKALIAMIRYFNKKA